jgi:hypothetical protein
MAKGSKYKGQAQSAIDLGASRADVLGVLQLLHSARVSAGIHCTDEVCGGILEKCILHLQNRHCLSQADFSDHLMWAEGSLPALLRLLDYAQVEVVECLDDAVCADQLRECIEHLAQIHQSSLEQITKREACTSH